MCIAHAATSQARAARQAKRLYDMCATAIVAEQGRSGRGGRSVGFDIDLPDVLGRASAGRDSPTMHPQTLRQYDRLGLVVPGRTDGGSLAGTRLRDVDAARARAQQLSQDEGINLAGIARILSLEEENRELRRQVERLRRPAGSSVFAADADGDIVEIERSRRARMWRRQIQVDARQLPSRESVEAARVAADAYDTRGGGVAGENEGIERGKPVSQPISRSIVLWGID